MQILACYILGEIGAPAVTLIPDLEKAKRTTLGTRRSATEAIKAIQQASEVKPASAPADKGLVRGKELQ